MRYKRAHTRNGVRHPAGDAFVGSLDSARFLYRKGVLEPDGNPEDPLVMGAPAPEWGYEPPPEPSRELSRVLDQHGTPTTTPANEAGDITWSD